MRAYADTSFIVKLLSQEKGASDAIDCYRRLERPNLYYLHLHGLEVENVLFQRVFHLTRSLPASERSAIGRERDRAFSRLNLLLARRSLIEVDADFPQAVAVARKLSQKHTERMGCRSLDLLHVAFALQLECESFLTFDYLQAEVAKAEGFKVADLSH